MPLNSIKIKDILIQGCKGQLNSEPMSAFACDLSESYNLPAEEKINEFERSRYILTTDAFYFYNKADKKLTKIDLDLENFSNVKTLIQHYFSKNSFANRDWSMRASIDDLQKIKTLTHHSPPMLNPHEMTKEELKNNYGSGFSKVVYNNDVYRVNSALEPSVELMADVDSNTSSLQQVCELIESIARHAKENRSLEGITRIITDEFSFYPQDKPFTLEEYKAIIEKVSEIAKALPADIHLVLATFPVVWPDGKLRNCGLHVESPSEADLTPVIRHFSKQRPHDNDPTYKKTDGEMYLYNSIDDNNIEALLPAQVLKNTQGLTMDNNQYQSAFKTSRKDGNDIIVSLGICFDHGNGVERGQVHGLIGQLKKSDLKVPMHCSHVITSSSIEEVAEHRLSTISHADPNPKYRRSEPTQMPGRSGYTASTLQSSFSGVLEAEHYPEKQIGILHSDLFQHASSNANKEELAALINQQDNEGNSMLHQVFSESSYDREMIAKRLYFLIMNGGDPQAKNLQGLSALELANNMDGARGDHFVSNAVKYATQWQQEFSQQNQLSPEDGQTMLTRMAINKAYRHDLAALILSGASPYIKNSSGLSTMDIIDAYEDEAVKLQTKAVISQALFDTQYGYIRNGYSAKDRNERWFPPFIPEKISYINMPKVEETVNNLLSLSDSDKRSTMSREDILLLVGEIALINQNIRDPRLAYDAIEYQLSQAAIPIARRLDEQTDSTRVKLLISTMQSVLVEKLIEEWPRVFLEAKDLSVFRHFSVEQHIQVFSTIEPKLENLFQKGTDLYHLSYLLPQERSEVFKMIRPKLDGMIQNINDLQFIQYLLPEERSEIFSVIKPVLNEIIKNNSDLDFIIKHLLPKERNEVIEVVEHKFQDLITGLYDLEFVQYLADDRRTQLSLMIIDKIEKDNFVQEDYDLVFFSYFPEEDARKMIHSIPDTGWDNISAINDLHSVTELMHDKAQDFRFIMDKIGDDLLASFRKLNVKKQSDVFEKFANMSEGALHLMKDFLPRLIKNSRTLVLERELASLTIMLHKAYLPNDLTGFEALVKMQDVSCQDLITKAVGENFSAQFKALPSAMAKEDFIRMKEALQDRRDAQLENQDPEYHHSSGPS